MSHCECPNGAEETYYEDVSPDWQDSESWSEKCEECNCLVEMH